MCILSPRAKVFADIDPWNRDSGRLVGHAHIFTFGHDAHMLVGLI